MTCSGHTASQIDEKQRFCQKERGRRKRYLVFLAPWVEHGIFGGPEAQQVPHLVAKLGEVLAQVVQVFHRGLIRALHLLPRGGQVAVNQATHDLLVVLITLLLQILPLLHENTVRSSD